MRKILREKINGVTWYIPEGEEYLKERLKGLKNPLSAEGSTVIKKGRRKSFTSLGASGQELYLKAFRLNSLPLRLKHLFFKTKALRELEMGLEAQQRGVSAVVPLAAGEKRGMGLVKECYLLIKKIEGAVDLKEYLLREDVPQHQRARVIEALGRLARKGHDAGIFQKDFALNNFLLENPQDTTPRIHLIDFERSALYRRVSERRRFWALAKLNRAGGDLSLTDRLRFLKGYLEGRPNKEWLENLERYTREILRKDAWRIGKASIKGGRGYKIYKNDTLRAYFLERYRIEDFLSSIGHTGGETRRNPGLLGVEEIRGKIRDGGVMVHRFLPLERPIDREAVRKVWQSTNALLKGAFPVVTPLAAIERGEEGLLITRHIPGSRDLKTVLKKTPPDTSKKQALLWHAARFLARLHGFGSLASDVETEDIVVKESPMGKIRLYLAHPYNFILKHPLEPEAREWDIQRLEAFLGGLIGKGEKKYLRRQYLLHAHCIG